MLASLKEPLTACAVRSTRSCVVVHAHVPGHVGLPFSIYRDRLRGRGLQLHALCLQRDIDFQRSALVVMEDRTDAARVACDEEARCLQVDQQWLAAHQLTRGLSHVPIRRRSARVRHPGGQVLRQLDGDPRLSVLIGRDLCLEEGRILEILAHRDDAQARLVAAAAAAAAFSGRLAFQILRVEVVGVGKPAPAKSAR